MTKFLWNSWMVWMLALAVLVPRGNAAPAPDLWPLAVKGLPASELEHRCAAIEAAAVSLPPDLRPAARFQKTFLRIISGAPETAWLPELQRYVAESGTTPGSPALSGTTEQKAEPCVAQAAPGGPVVARALADISRAWIARSAMRGIDEALRKHYRKHVAFPETLAVVEADLPDGIRHDPWGQPWVYRTHAPALGERFAKFSTQRYTIGPARYPELGPLAAAIGNRTPSLPEWKLFVRDMAGRKALEFRNGGTVTIIEPGGKLGIYTLLYLSDGWALLASADQLFTVPL